MGCVPSSSRLNSSLHETTQPIVPESHRERFEKRRSQANNQETVNPLGTPKVKKKKGSKQPTNGRNTNLFPYYDRLPPKSKKCKVKSVYDGDTITLYNKRRVRLLGIDTPELQPKQAFSEEAREYTKERCLEQHIWISFETGGEQEDRFGRLLAWVWIPNDDGTFECVNEGLLKEGLASVYTPSKSTKLSSKNKLLALQKEAKASRRGMWRRFRDYDVVQTAYGTAFHHKDGKCEHLKRSKKLVTTLASTALDEGRHACRTCLAEEDHTETTRSSHVSVY
ncbi:function [Seminavis robusta]|uniref:Function n=1 Tax=Seminavis robusta TaxID=568900 RepID=A0A9N8HXC6_9STRA|nr:function [Seminavis robusta]|eukprot:Sro2417_g326940.1 function (280) ;mRNA; r:3821-4660